MKIEPKIRIKGFEGEWKIDELSNLFTERVESDIYAEMLSVTLSQGIIKAKENGRYDNSNNDKSKYRLVKVGDIAYNSMRMWQGASGYSPYYGIVSPAYTVVVPNNNVDSCFFAYMFKTAIMIKQFRLHSQGLTTDTWNLKFPAFSKIVVTYPADKAEQRKLASFFRHIDSLIETADKKLASLKQVKEASLQSMFPKEGQKVPEVRFKGFEGEWKATLLKEISQKVVEKNVKLQYKITLTNSAEYGIIDQLDFFDHKISNNDNIRNYYIVRDRDFVYNPRISTSAPVGPINQNLLGYVGVVSPLYYVFRIHNIDECYLRYFFKTKLWHTFMKDNGNSGARFDRLSITDDIFEKMPIIHPADTAEQRKIASFFVHIDKQIAIAQQRLDLLRRIKSACLDEMFV